MKRLACVPSKRVTVAAVELRREDRCSLAAIRSIRCWSSASRSVKDLLWRTAVSARALLRPRLAQMLRR